MARIRCPKCGSEQFTTHQRGYSGLAGLFGYRLFGPSGILLGSVQSADIYATCLECGKRWQPGRQGRKGGCGGCLALIAIVLFGVPLLFALFAAIFGPSRPPERRSDVAAPPEQSTAERETDEAPTLHEAVAEPDASHSAREEPLPTPNAQPEIASEPEPEPEPEWRIWADATGDFQREAVFKGMSFGQVKLLPRNGQEITVPLDRLSLDDQEWIRRRRY